MYSAIDGRHGLTKACRHTVGGLVNPRFSGVAICQHEGEEGIYLLYCDEKWQAITDTWHLTVAAAMHQAEFEFEGISDTWQQNRE